MGKRWKDPSHEVINVNNYPVEHNGSSTDAWFAIEGCNWNCDFSGISSISVSSNKGGFSPDDVDTIAWQPSRGIGSNDNIYLWNRHNGVGAVITKTTPYGDNYTLRKNITDYGIPKNYINGYHVKKNDKPVANSGDITEHVDVDYNYNMNGGFSGFLINDFKKYERVKLKGDNISNIGKPCPGTDRVGFVEPRKIRCLYNQKEINTMLQQFNNYSGSNKRVQLKDRVLNTFCQKAGNENVTVGGKMCMNYPQFSHRKQVYCETGSRIKDDPDNCGKGKYNNFHASAVKYCDLNPTDLWCRCYNTQKNCRVNENNPGCDTYKATLAAYKKFKDSASYQQLITNLPCALGCGGGIVYLPASQTDCPKSVTICGASINIGGAVSQSTAAVTQACGREKTMKDEAARIQRDREEAARKAAEDEKKAEEELKKAQDATAAAEAARKLEDARAAAEDAKELAEASAKAEAAAKAGSGLTITPPSAPGPGPDDDKKNFELNKETLEKYWWVFATICFLFILLIVV